MCDGMSNQTWLRTLFADETVIAVVGVICVAETSMGVFELQELVAVLSRVPCAIKRSENAVKKRGGATRAHICQGKAKTY